MNPTINKKTFKNKNVKITRTQKINISTNKPLLLLSFQLPGIAHLTQISLVNNKQNDI